MASEKRALAYFIQIAVFSFVLCWAVFLILYMGWWILRALQRPAK